MTQNYKKKLIEVAIPLEAINAASAREKSIRHGHPSTLHLWWARRPLAACRAVLFAQLVDDPSSHPDEFPTPESQEMERKRLFAIIEDLVKWENSTNEEVLERARSEIRKSCGRELPPVYDPFSGGGSIPLEAQRLGLPTYGSDLNPVAVMIGKAMIEIPPKFKDMEPVHPGLKDRNHYRNAEGLAEDVRYYGELMREKAWDRIGHLYPEVDLPKEYGGGKATVIAWVWARTVPSPDPAFSDVQVPVASNFLLSSKKGKEAWVKPIVDRKNKIITYTIQNGGTKEEIAAARAGTKAGRGANFRCVISNTAITSDHVKSAANASEMKEQIIALVVATKAGRIYLPPTDKQLVAANAPEPAWKPDQKMDPNSKDLLSGRGYGINSWFELFLPRQLFALNDFCDSIENLRLEIKDAANKAGMPEDKLQLLKGGTGATAYAEAISIYLAFAVSKATTRNCALAIWEPGMGRLAGALGRQVLPMQWTFAETHPLSGTGGDIAGTAKSISEVLEKLTPSSHGQVFQRNAAVPLVENPVPIISTDPPYYDNIEYADLSDFFYIWLRRNLTKIAPDLFGTIAVPKMEQLVASPHRHGGREGAHDFFMDGMTTAISTMAQEGNPVFPTTIYYAFKQSDIEEEGIASAGWSSFLEAVLSAGFTIVGTWPVRTEATNALKKGMNALATSVVLVCRKKEKSAEAITRAEFIRTLKRELPSAIEELQAANVSPADMPQSAIGPGMGVFSRYKAVLEADDSPMTVKTALQLINAELDEYLNDLHGDFDPDTRFAASWFEQNGYEKGDYGAANSIAMARGIAVESVKHAGIVESAAGKVRILKRAELDHEWNPIEDDHLTIWECCQHLIRVLENDGEYATAILLKKIGSDKAETVKDLAYYLYEVCSTKRQDAKEANSYNGLIAIWTELTRQAATIRIEDVNRQSAMDI